jgi:hypothetical protein
LKKFPSLIKSICPGRKSKKDKQVENEVEFQQQNSSMRFAIKDTLTEEELQSGLRALIKDEMTRTSRATLMGTAFLVAFALELGASNLVTGLMSAISP